MTEPALRLAVITGSVREGRVGPTVARWFVEQAGQYGRFATDPIDLAAFPLPLDLPRPGSTDPDTAAVFATLSSRLAAADAFVLVTPEYNQSLPASLKNAIDWSGSEWRAKPVGLVSYGGRAGGTRAAEHARQVLISLEAVTVRDVISFQYPKEVFGDDGRPKDAEGCAAAAKGMLRQLDWWATVLRDGRSRRPYAG
ncbi:NAD(P)H-dependent oxidoreductase [Nonomuraea sp. NPDC046802]|uniref:NADPH-dependent FMN reductase n=1 Tax=Nonomuraea sp. NPDC046802 TaxID=3154919 RepID=UPI0034006234